MARCHRGHVRIADRQRRCIECRRGYDRARAGTDERRASWNRYSQRRGTDISFGLRVLRSITAWEAKHGSL